ncbi:DNA-cytosine methyltransferase [Brevundimonas sp. 1080]
MNPEFIVMENVPEIFDDKHWAATRASMAYLEDLGFRVRAQVHNLADFGVPQARFRALLIARRAGQAFNMPATIVGAQKTVRDAIYDLPALKAGEASASDAMHVAPNHISRVLELIRSVPKDGGSRKSANLALLPNCHSQVDGFRDVYGRLAWDRPAISITAKCSTPSCGRFLHPEQDRNISVREAALLQGFPADYQFSGPLVQRYRQIGNAVSPTFAAAVAACIKSEIREPSLAVHGLMHDVRAAQGRSFTSSIAGRKRGGAKGRSDRLVAIDLFAGAGGLSLGLQEAGFEIVKAFDHDPDAVQTYRYNLGDHVHKLDALAVKPDQLLERLGVGPGRIDLLAGGPPCQGFSQQRRGSDQDERNDLVLWYANAIAAIKPRAFLLENVPYIAAKRGRAILERFLRTTEEAGYSVATAVLNAKDFGVPQHRPRFVAIGYLGSDSIDLEAIRKVPARTVRDAIGGLPTPSDSDRDHPTFANHLATKISELNRQRISFVPEGGGWKDIPEHLQLDCHKNHKGHGHLDVFGRLSWSGVAQTITAHSDSFSRGRYAHPTENRPLTGRELAALQSFPNWFRFLADKKSVARLVGNAVPPLMARCLGELIAARLATQGSSDRSSSEAPLRRAA